MATWVPLLASYNASKHAVKGYTDTLRIEMIKNDAPVSVTLIKPSAIGTPFPEHGRNETGFEAKLPPPVYAPELVAGAILAAAQAPHRSITVGFSGKFQVLGATMLPWLFDQIAARMSDTLINFDEPIGESKGNLYAPQGDNGRVQGRQKGRRFSAFTSAHLHPWATLGAAAALGAVGTWLVAGRPARA